MAGKITNDLKVTKHFAAEPLEAPKRVFRSKDQLIQAEVDRRGIEANRGIEFSIPNQPDFDYETDGKKVEVKFLHNSELNGLAFQEEGDNVYHIHTAVASSNDRTTENVTMCRAHVARNGPIAFTGRPDTPKKARQQAEFLMEHLPQKNFHYVVNSLMSPSEIHRVFPRFGQVDERQSTIDEFAVLQNPIEVNGRVATPIMFINFFNTFSILGEILPERISGKDLIREINGQGYARLKALAKEANIGVVYRRMLDDCFYQIEQGKLLPEEEFMTRDVICKILNVPHVDHCKSSTDRTSIAVSLSSAIAEWRDGIPEDESGRFAPHLLLKNEAFKERFAVHAQAFLEVTKVARGRPGFSWGAAAQTNPLLVRILPERFLEKAEPLPLKGKVIFGALAFIFGVVGLFSGRWNKLGHIRKLLSSKQIRQDSGFLKSPL